MTSGDSLLPSGCKWDAYMSTWWTASVVQDSYSGPSQERICLSVSAMSMLTCSLNPRQQSSFQGRTAAKEKKDSKPIVGGNRNAMALEQTVEDANSPLLSMICGMVD